MKPFLYLVQSRLANLNQYQDLESETSDVLYLTFEEKIDKPNYLYAPNTCWASGRNCLIEAAKKLDDRYEYYIMLDDDLDFIGDNGFRTFEEEVLEVKPDFATPIYMDIPFNLLVDYEKLIRGFIQRNIFRCSHFIHIDSAFICLSHEMFFNETLLPYNTEYIALPQFKNSFYPSRFFWYELFEYHNHRKLYVINKVKITNIQHITEYNTNYNINNLNKMVDARDPNYKYTFIKVVTGIRALDSIAYLLNSLRRCREILPKGTIPRGTIRGKIPEWLIYHVYVKILKVYVYSLALVRDIHLTYQMRKERRGS